MIDEEITTKVMEAVEDITWEDGGSAASEIICSRLQPLIDADREKIERYEKALRFYADKENWSLNIGEFSMIGDNGDKVHQEHMEGWPVPGQRARQALGEGE